jgi:hypothetical protein
MREGVKHMRYASLIRLVLLALALAALFGGTKHGLPSPMGLSGGRLFF